MDDGEILRILRKAASARYRAASSSGCLKCCACGSQVNQGPLVQQRVKSYSQNLLASRAVRSAVGDANDATNLQVAVGEPDPIHRRQLVGWVRARRLGNLGRAFERWVTQSPLSRAILENDALAAQACDSHAAAWRMARAQVRRLERKLKEQQRQDQPTPAQQATTLALAQ